MSNSKQNEVRWAIGQEEHAKTTLGHKKDLTLIAHPSITFCPEKRCKIPRLESPNGKTRLHTVLEATNPQAF